MSPKSYRYSIDKKSKTIEDIMNVIGIGRITAINLIEKYKIKSAKELKELSDSGKAPDLNEKIKLGLKYLGKFEGNIPRKELDKIYDLLEKYKDSCPNLINSFFFPWQKDNGFNEDLINLHNNDGELESLIVSNYIFQIVGLYTQASTMTSVSDSRFLIFFSSFFRSKLLKNKWDKFKINFGVRNVLLCDKLFEINEKYNFKSGEELKNYFENYVQTDEFIKIMTTVDTTNVTQRNSAIVQ